MKKSIFIIIFILIFCFALEAVMTYPLVFNINKYIPAFFSTDESYHVLWHAWFVKFSAAHHISVKSTDFIAYPFGVDFYTNKPIIYIWNAINYFLPLLTTPILTYNLQVIFNIFLTGLFTYLLVYYLTKNKAASFFSGITFAFCPYMFVRSWQHLGETYLWIMPLALLSLFVLRDNPRKAVKILFVLALILSTIGINFYFIGVAFAAFLAYLSVNSFRKKTIAARDKKCIINIIWLSLAAFIILLPQNYPIIKGLISSRNSVASAQNIYHRPFEDLFMQSAKPLSYFLPAAVHPIFGKFTENFIGSHLYGMSFTEHTLYLGWTTLVLAFIAFRKRRRERRQQVDNNENFYIGFFILLAVVAWFFSQPPWWRFGPIKVYMPSFFMYKLMPMFRAYCRFGVMVMFAVAVLAGFGLNSILRRFNSGVKRIAATALFCGLILFEFWNYPPFKVSDVSRVPDIYYWLKAQREDFVIAEYPLDIEGADEMYKLYQTVHEKKMINATNSGTPAHNLMKTITRLSDPHTAGVLKWMNVKYVFVHREDYINTELIEQREELKMIPSNPRLKLIKNYPAQDCPRRDIMCIQKTGPIDVYEVIAQPIKPEIQ